MGTFFIFPALRCCTELGIRNLPPKKKTEKKAHILRYFYYKFATCHQAGRNTLEAIKNRKKGKKKRRWKEIFPQKQKATLSSVLS